MNREYHFKIEESEMMEYYRYVFALTPKNKTRVVWIKASIPVLLGFTLWYFRIYRLLWVDIAAIIVGLVWMFYLSGKLWNRFIEGQVKNWFEKNVKTASFSDVCVKFNDNIEINKEKIPYSKLNRVLPLKHILVFFYDDNKIFIIPNRIIGNENAMLEFSELLKSKMNSN